MKLHYALKREAKQDKVELGEEVLTSKSPQLKILIFPLALTFNM